MTNPLGVNVDITRIQNKDLFKYRMRALDPALMVARIENDNDIDKIEALAADLPNATIHARVVTEQEGNYHLRPQGKDDRRPTVAEPEACIDRWKRLGQSNMSLYLLNEPDDDGDSRDPDAIDRLNKWVSRSCSHATATKTHITVFNWGVQMPFPDNRFDQALEAMSIHRQYVTLGVHEYLPKKDIEGNRRIAYFVNILAHYKRLGKPAPVIANTEFGYDGADGTDLSDFMSRGITPLQYAAETVEVIENDYRSYIDDGSFQGLALFSYTLWKRFGLEGWPDFWAYILNWNYSITPTPKPEKPIESPPVVAPPPPVPVPTPAPVPAPKPEPEWYKLFDKTELKMIKGAIAYSLDSYPDPGSHLKKLVAKMAGVLDKVS